MSIAKATLNIPLTAIAWNLKRGLGITRAQAM
jgi:hypothetical protein